MMPTWEVGVKGTDWKRLIDAPTPGRAKYQYWRDVREAWPDMPFTAMSCRKLHGPKPPTADDLAQREADVFNDVHFPLGTMVHYWSGLMEGPPTGTGPIKHLATVVSQHAVAWIEGARSCHSITHVERANGGAA